MTAPACTADEFDYAMLRRHARVAPAPALLAVAGTLALGQAAGVRPLVRGLSEAQFRRMLAHYFDGLEFANGEGGTAADADEFDDLLQLLLDHRSAADEEGTWLCHVIASAALRENHLWQDLGLPDRAALNELLASRFPRLHALNTGHMRWKKFFYRQLCAREGLLLCKSPHCAACVDYAECFGPEEGAPPGR